jgi:hypothetical protein
MQGKGKSLQAAKAGQVGRRDFLRILGVGGVAAGATTLASGSAHADGETEDEKKKARYRETDHVKAFYRVNRYPAKR